MGTVASVMTNGLETLSKRLMSLEEMQQDFDHYDIRIPEVFQKFVLAKDDPRTIYLDAIFDKIPEGNKIASIQKSPPQEFVVYKGRGLVAEVKEIKSFIKVNHHPDYVGNFLSSMEVGFGDVEELLRVPMREIMQKCIKENHLEELIRLPEKKFYHIPTRPDEIHRFNYLVVAQRKKIKSREKTVKALCEMDIIKAEELLRALFTVAEKTSFIDDHVENVRLNKKGNKFVIVDTEPFDAYDVVFNRPTEANLLQLRALRIENAIRSFREFKRMLYLSNDDRMEALKVENPKVYEECLLWGIFRCPPQTNKEKALNALVEKIIKELTPKIQAFGEKTPTPNTTHQKKPTVSTTSKVGPTSPKQPIIKKPISPIAKIVKIALFIIFAPITVPLLICRVIYLLTSNRKRKPNYRLIT